MHALGYLIIALARVIGLIVNLYTLVIVAAVFISWVNADPYNPVVKILRQLTDPVFALARRIIPRRFRYARIDVSPLIVLIALVLVDTVLSGVLFDLGRQMLQ